MNKIVKLEVECLTNMPMILDVISNTIHTLEEILNPIFDEIESTINKNGFKTSDVERERGTIYPFALQGDFNRKKSYYEGLKPEIELLYIIPFSEKTGRKKTSLEVRSGYLMDGGQNVIYFQLSEYDDTSVYINDTFAESVQPLLSEQWRFGYDEGSIYIEFDIDESLSEEKIQALSKDFTGIILKELLRK